MARESSHTQTLNDMLPGGYTFIHLAFWPIVALVALGTNFIPIALTAGLGLLVFESVKK